MSNTINTINTKISGTHPNLRLKLRANIEAKKIARSGLDNAYDQLEVWKKLLKRLRKQKKDVSGLEIKIAVLAEEIAKIEFNSDNMQYGDVCDGGNGFGSSGGDCGRGG